ncbi:hypothetical protein [Rhodovastum atsumiense]|nr:hypothetical protein [Rhodovastum atsumiense]
MVTAMMVATMVTSMITAMAFMATVASGNHVQFEFAELGHLPKLSIN